jgi:hypothetical protein
MSINPRKILAKKISIGKLYQHVAREKLYQILKTKVYHQEIF